MKRDKWIDAVGKIDFSYVKEAKEWKKEKRSVIFWKRIVPMTACAAVLVCGAFFMWEQLIVRNLPDLSKKDTAAYEDMQESADAQMAENLQQTADLEKEEPDKTDSADSGEYFVVNEVNQIMISEDDLAVYVSEPLNLTQLEEYYSINFGVDITPETVPQELNLKINYEICFLEAENDEEKFEQDTVEIGKAEERPMAQLAGNLQYNEFNELICDNNTIAYEDAGGTKSLKIGVRSKETGRIVQFDESDLNISSVKDTNITIGHLRLDSEEQYVAIFEKNGVTFTIETKNFSQEELFEILRQLCGE